jgi:drug/metabolite transporter (DMT)-like permease
MKKTILQSFSVVFLLAFICDFLWGSAFPCIKLGYALFQIQSKDTAAQILFAGLRFVLAGVMVIFIASVGHKKLVYPSNRKSVGRILTLGCFQTILQYILFYVGLAHTSGVKGSVIEASNVFICILVTCLIFRMERLTARKLVGSLLGFIGVVIINLQGLQLNFNVGDAGILLSTCSYAVSSVLVKKYADKDDVVMLSGYQFLFGGVILCMTGWLCGGRISCITGESAALLLYLAFVSAAAYSLWGILLKYNPVSKIAIFGFLNPVCGVLLSALLLGETQQAFGIRSLLALGFVAVGIIVVYYKNDC